MQKTAKLSENVNSRETGWTDKWTNTTGSPCPKQGGGADQGITHFIWMEKRHKHFAKLSTLCQSLLHLAEEQEGKETKEIACKQNAQEGKKKKRLEQMRNPQKKRKRKEIECAPEKNSKIYSHTSPIKWTINFPSSPIFPLYCPVLSFITTFALWIFRKTPANALATSPSS